MGITNKEYFLLFVMAYLLVGALTPLMRRIAIATDVIDRPNSSHKSHKQPVPYLGGLAIIIGVIAVSYSTSLVSNFTTNTISGPPTFKVVVLGDINVGKTSLIKRCIDNIFNENEDASMGA